MALWAGLIGLVCLLAGGGYFGWRRRQRATDADRSEHLVDDNAPTVALENTPPSTPPPAVPAQPAVSYESSLPRISGPEFRRADETGIAVKDLDDSQEDLPDFFADLEALFRQTLAVRPEQIDVRLKLLEICHSIGDADKFISEALIIRDLLGAEVDDRWDAVVDLGSSLLPNHPLFATQNGSGATPAASRAPRTGRHYDRLARELLDPAVTALSKQYTELRANRLRFRQVIKRMQDMLLRPTPLELIWPSSPDSGAAIFLKRENSSADQAIMINACGQGLLAGELGYKRIVSAARSWLHAQALARMVRPLKLTGTLFLDARLANSDPQMIESLTESGLEVIQLEDPETDCRIPALQKFIDAASSMMYISDLGGGPSPYPRITRDLQAIVGMELNRQLRTHNYARPDALITAYESGQAGLGLFVPYLEDEHCSMYCTTRFIEHRGTGMADSVTGIEMRGAREHAWLRACGRVEYREVSEDAAATVFDGNAQLSTVDATAENGRALALAREIGAGLPQSANIVVMLADSSREPE